MVRAVDSRSLGDQIGHLSLDEIASVDDALELVLALS
jgi:mRNA-degrading endonuclease toxin of MazEF toxin-antitoxin module